MKVIRLNEPGNWEELNINKPSEVLSSGNALLKVKKIGVCGTDLHAFKGQQPFFNYPRVLGHELAVEVVAVADDVINVSIGDKCSVEPYYNDIIGQAVKRGKTNCGEHLQVLGVHVDGGMQEYFVYPAKFLHATNSLSDDQLAMIEPLAIGCHAVDRADIKEDDIVLVIGVGPIGLGTIQFAKLKGARVIAMDIDDSKLEQCKEITKVEDTINALGNVEEELATLLNGDLPTVILDATGNPTSMMNTFKYAAAGGTIVFIGLFMGDVVFHDPSFHKKELTLKASRAALGTDFGRIIKLIEEGKIDATSFITHRMCFDEVPTEFEKLYKQKDLIKAIIEIN
ncbi:zinc-binding alcohol dehydrogenase family protein [Seonamhaeicola maritimus]|uniref:Zinc-binding alcohol dehydrogenase family protein n=1 Tax=Seonamhaeicola maritimus TaxID=2591822 RepID=A0A5C7GLC9_9FLAO|nr:zinc-binding alcohol dehydrogenase family protein [Seonamhaeicola maritimus]TXG39110.1 zinc-binding alcohol dehydrogenase family protein [Seonamhaeicola maritimus]